MVPLELRLSSVCGERSRGGGGSLTPAGRCCAHWVAPTIARSGLGRSRGEP